MSYPACCRLDERDDRFFTDFFFQLLGGAQNIKLKPKEKKTTEDGASDKVKGKGGFRGFRGFM